MNAHTHQKVGTGMLTTALDIKAKSYQQPKRPSTVDWISKRGYTHLMEEDTVMTKSALLFLLRATTSVHFTDIRSGSSNRTRHRRLDYNCIYRKIKDRQTICGDRSEDSG